MALFTTRGHAKSETRGELAVVSRASSGIYPTILRAFYAMHAVAPGVVAWTLRQTSTARPTARTDAAQGHGAR